MSWFDKLLPRNAVPFVMSNPTIGSPWTTTQLTKIALAELAGVQVTTIGRAECMHVPAVAKARGLIVGLSKQPLTLWRPNPDDPTGDSDFQLPTPRWLTSTKTGMSPRLRMAWTLDDLIFSGLSLWAVERDGDTITDALRVDPSEWSVNPDGGVLVRGTPVTDPKSVILFEGIQEGLITLAEDEIRGMLDMSRAWRQRVEAPVPLVELHITDPNVTLTDEEQDDAIDDWEAARRGGGTAITPPYLETKIHGDVKSDLYTEGRNASRLDIANYLQVPASLLEGSQATASLTYHTKDGDRSDFIDMCLSYWAQPIEARLSQDDVTPDGTAVRFDYSSIATPIQPTTIASTED